MEIFTGLILRIHSVTLRAPPLHAVKRKGFAKAASYRRASDDAGTSCTKVLQGRRGADNSKGDDVTGRDHAPTTERPQRESRHHARKTLQSASSFAKIKRKRVIRQESPVSFLLNGEVILFLKAENLSFTERNKIALLFIPTKNL